jgi:adenylosuccinate synthase
VRLEPDTEALNRFDHVLFEGAQGLLLDEEHPWFPHVTRSKTGLKNVASLMREASLGALRTVFVTRWYLTRHGAGPFPTEVPGKPAPGIEDRTNLANDWQGSLRFGLLDLAALGDTLRQELAQPLGVSIEASLAVTCLDQADAWIPFRAPQASTVRAAAFPALLRDHTHLEVEFRSYGPTRRDILASPRINAV